MRRRDRAQAAWLPRPPAKDQKGVNPNQHEVKEDRESNSGFGFEQDRKKNIQGSACPCWIYLEVNSLFAQKLENFNLKWFNYINYYEI